jgi:hypothetical protein
VPDRIFDVKAPATAPFGLFGWLFMGAMLGGIPLMAVAIVVAQMGASDPGTTAIVSLTFMIPVAILYALHRLFTKFRLSVLSDGSIEYVQPFKTMRLAPGHIATMNWSATRIHASNRQMNWLVLGDAQGNKIEAISPMAFGDKALRDFVAVVLKANPNTRMTG